MILIKDNKPKGKIYKTKSLDHYITQKLRVEIWGAFLQNDGNSFMHTQCPT